MKKFEYKVVDNWKDVVVSGRDGWELVSSNGGFFYLKREYKSYEGDPIHLAGSEQ